ncbi:MAG: hypothetical protein U1F37_10670 [Alphaproteobacteria bacterium]
MAANIVSSAQNWPRSFARLALAAAAAAVLALAVKSLAEAAGFEKLLFGFGTGIDNADAPATAHRTAVYPLFVALLRPLGTTATFAVQAFLFFLAGFVLFARLAAVLPQARWARILAALACAAALLNPRVLEYPLSISEEALFVPAVMALTAALLAYCARPGLLAAAGAGLLLGLAYGIRPIGGAFAPMALVALLAPLAIAGGAPAGWRKPVLGALAAVLGFGAAAGFERLAHATMVGNAPGMSILGLNLIAKVPFIIEKGDLADPTKPPEEAAALAEVEAVLVRAGAFAARAEAALATWDGRQFFANYLEFAFQMRGQSPELGAAIRRLAELRGRHPTIVVGEVAFAAIEKRPLRFAGRVLGNVVRTLALAEMPGAAGLRDVDRFTAGAARDWLATPAGRDFRRPREVADAYRLPSWGLRLAHAAAVVGTALVLLVAAAAALRRRRLRADAAIGLVVAAGYFAYVLACAAVINAQVRYVLTIWPLTAALALLGFAIAVRAFAGAPHNPAR